MLSIAVIQRLTSFEAATRVGLRQLTDGHTGPNLSG
jgi:hypothetical protein